MSIPKTLSVDQCQALLVEIMRNHGTEKQMVRSIRNSAMAVIMLETGIRVGEMCGLRIDDLWFSEQPVENLVIRKEIAKNKKERTVPISSYLNSSIISMSQCIWCIDDALPTAYAFYARSPNHKLTTRSVERIIESAGKTALNIAVTPHMLRHTFGSKMMRKTNSRIVQALLGHESLQSTQIYMHPYIEDLKKAIHS